MTVSNRITAIGAGLLLLIGACTSTTPTESTSATTVPAVGTSTTTSVADSTTTTTTADTTTAAAETTTTTVASGLRLEIGFAGGEVTGGGRLDIPLGEDVTISITSDTADEGHLHGYDIFLDLEAGETAELVFTADIPGIFELELENSHIDLAELQVAP